MISNFSLFISLKLRESHLKTSGNYEKNESTKKHCSSAMSIEHPGSVLSSSYTILELIGLMQDLVSGGNA